MGIVNKNALAEPILQKSKMRGKKVIMKEVAEKKKYKVPFWKTVRKHWMLLAMLAPAVIYVIIFSYIPMTGIVLAFKN